LAWGSPKKVRLARIEVVHAKRFSQPINRRILRDFRPIAHVLFKDEEVNSG
jgi:hypothetical protein